MRYSIRYRLHPQKEKYSFLRHHYKWLNGSTEVRWYSGHMIQAGALRKLILQAAIMNSEDINTFYKLKSQLRHWMNTPFN